MLPLSPPKGGSKRYFAVKTSSGEVVALPFRYLMVHRWIAGDVHIHLKFVLKVIHPF